jgi:hypothetical protein
MSLHVIEGTWEEIERHKPELMGHMLRVTIMPEKPVFHKSRAAVTEPKAAPQAKVLRGRGMFAGILSTEDYLREKREDTIREDRSL